MKWMPNSMLLPFAHPVSTHLWTLLPLPHLTTLLNWTRSSSTSHFLLAMILKTLLQTAATPVLHLRTLFVFQTLEHSRHNPNPTNAQTCLNNSESNAKPFALNPINLVDSDAIANAFLQYQAEFMTLTQYYIV
jgi:hypothetical protein